MGAAAAADLHEVSFLDRADEEQKLNTTAYRARFPTFRPMPASATSRICWRAGPARQRAAQGKRLEAQVGDWNTVPASLLELLARYRRAVARIVIPGGQVDYRNLRVDSGWTGTGFLVAPNLLLTNHHVLNSVAVAGAAVAEFDYEWPSDKLFANDEAAEPAVARFELAPTRLFVTSPAT